MADIRPFHMPKWGIEMTEGTISAWKIAEGDAFKRGDVLCDIETDKITNEVEAEYDAVARRILVPAGGEAQPVGTLLAVFADASTSDDEIAAFVAGFKPAGNAAVKKADPVVETAPAPALKAKARKVSTNRPISPQALAMAEREGADLAAIVGSGRGGRITYQDVHQALRGPATPALRGPTGLPEEDLAIFASPLARRIAALHGVDLSNLNGTGPRGRICKADVLAMVQATPGAERGPFTPVENRPVTRSLDKIQAVTAKRLTEAKQTIPHFYLQTGVAVDQLLALRRTANLVLGTQASLNDYLVKAAAMALVDHPTVNVQLHGDQISSFPHADVAIAVASPRGLVTPIVRQANRMSIDQLAAASRDLIERARNGRLSWQDLDGGTFTVSNLGMYGVESFHAIINPPQAAILAVGAATRVPVGLADEGIRFETRIALTLSVDHRAIDGAAAAQFLATLKQLIEAPEGLFA